MASLGNPGALALLSLAIVAAACSNNPVAPDLSQPPLPSASSPSSEPAAPTSASLAIEDFSVIVKPSPIDSRGVSVVDGWFSLEVRFALRETGNNSGATVHSFFLGDGAGGGAMFDGFCIGNLVGPRQGDLEILTLSPLIRGSRITTCDPYLSQRCSVLRQPTLKDFSRFWADR